MLAYEVKDMSCGHCVKVITDALHQVDRDAGVRIDLASHRVEVEPHAADAAVLMQAISDAGYTPRPL